MNKNTFPDVRVFEVAVCREDDKMDHLYGNVDHRHGKRNCFGWTGQPTRERNPLSSRTLKILLAALSLLLLCALVVLCVLGILYFNKAVSFEALSEQYASAIFRLSVQEHNASETERKYKLLKVKYQRAHEVFNKSCECQNCTLCGEGWMYYGEKCYYFSTDKLDWMKSRDHCAEKGSHLVIITSQAQQSFVSSRIGETHWIGLNDLETEGKWMWVNNQTLTETGVKFWKNNEPDNWRHEDPSGENCAALGNRGGDTHQWFDAPCREMKKYLCEK